MSKTRGIIVYNAENITKIEQLGFYLILDYYNKDGELLGSDYTEITEIYTPGKSEDYSMVITTIPEDVKEIFIVITTTDIPEKDEEDENQD